MFSNPELKLHIDVKGPNDCWPWIGLYTGRGYGKLWTKEHTAFDAYRLAYEDRYGPVSVGLELDHTCRNRICCNPKHMECVTHSENMKRMWKRGTTTGKSTGTAHGRARFTREEVQFIKDSEKSSRQLAAVFGCDKTQILRIRSGKTYKKDGVEEVHHLPR